MLVNRASARIFVSRNNRTMCPTLRAVEYTIPRVATLCGGVPRDRLPLSLSRGRETSRDRSVDDTRRRNENEDPRREIDRKREREGLLAEWWLVVQRRQRGCSRRCPSTWWWFHCSPRASLYDRLPSSKIGAQWEAGKSTAKIIIQ